MYDIIFISKFKTATQLAEIRNRFPLAKHASSLQIAQQISLTKMFWAVWDDTSIANDFAFDFLVPEWDQEYIHVFKNGQFFDGICLVPKHASISKRESEYRFFVNKKEVDIIASMHKPFDKFYIDTYEEYLTATETSTTDMFWVIWNDFNILDDFKFDYQVPVYDQHMTHVFGNGEYFDGICLMSTNKQITKREFEYRFFSEKKEVDIVASMPKSFDKFYIDTYEEYLAAVDASTSGMFWVIPSDVVVDNTFEFDYQVPTYDQRITHVFCNGNYYDGICLFSKDKPITKREFEYRFFTEKKEVDIVASMPKSFDKFYIDTYEEYLTAVDASTTDMFWAVWNDIVVTNDFKFDYQVPVHDQRITHVFRNGNYYDGVCLLSKHRPITKREFEYRFFTEKKEVDVQASTPKPFDKFYIDTYEEYLAAVTKTSTSMFWVIPSDVVVDNTFEFDYQVPVHDQRITHVFRNGNYYDGICLFSKDKLITRREFEYRFFTEKKEVDVQASTPKPFDKFYIDTYEEYLAAVDTSTSGMFWVVWNDIVVTDDFKFNHQVPAYEQRITHVFRNGEYFDGVCLFSTNAPITKREFEYRFFTEKKEVDIQASVPRPYDIVFISYNEPSADDNYKKLLIKAPTAKRIHGVTGIHQAHIEAAKVATSDLFWVVDGDAEIVNEFNFDFPQVVHFDSYTKTIVHVWRSRNPVNGLEYGYGGVKLLPRTLTLDMDVTSTDMTMSISSAFKSMDEVSNITAFNTDEFSTWRSAFRECVKLSTMDTAESQDRLAVWSTVAHGNYSNEALRGARAGAKYGQENAADPAALRLINDFTWLKNRWSAETP